MAPASLTESAGEQLFLESEQRASRTQVNELGTDREAGAATEGKLGFLQPREGRDFLLPLPQHHAAVALTCGRFQDLKHRMYTKEPLPSKGLKDKSVWPSAAS